MADDLEPPEDERAIELFSIAAIFPELVIHPENPFRASIEVPVSPTKPLAVVFPPQADGVPPVALPTPPSSNGIRGDGLKKEDAGTQTAPLEVVQDIRYLSHLPPLSLEIQLPEGYPSEKAPEFSLSTKTSWLPKVILEQLKDEGDKLWEERGRDQVVFDYIDYLQQAAEKGFDLGNQLDISQDIKISMLDFDSKTKREKFEKETFDCGICLEPKKGAACYRMLACAHVFCVECLQDFYNTCITEGDITNVKCLDPDCGKESKPAIVAQNTEGTKSRKKRRKEDRTLGPSELLQIPLEQEIVQRYVKLKRKKKLESDPTTVYCPRQWCQGPARSKKHSRTSDFDNVAESESEDEDQPENVEPATHAETSPQPDQRLAICEDCAFAFCKICKSSWHGEFVRCRPLQKYGLTAEEKASEEYLKLHTSPCPTCTAPCQKTMGCNHMICFKCNTHFCYLCSAWLDTNNPYAHYNTLKSPCNQRLWELEGGDGGEDVGLGFGGGPQDGDQIHDVLLPWEEVEVLDEDSDDDPPPPLPPPAPAPPRAAPIPRVVLPPVIIRPGPAIPPAAGPQPRRGNGNPRRVNPEPGIRRPPADGGNVPIANGGGRGVGGRGLAGHGLQRFLRMVEDDEEDEWDSDELDDDDEEGLGGNWEIPIR